MTMNCLTSSPVGIDWTKAGQTHPIPLGLKSSKIRPQTLVPEGSKARPNWYALANAHAWKRWKLLFVVALYVSEQGMRFAASTNIKSGGTFKLQISASWKSSELKKQRVWQQQTYINILKRIQINFCVRSAMASATLDHRIAASQLPCQHVSMHCSVKRFMCLN